MDCKIEIIPRLLHFKQPAGTSRGVYTTRKVWYLHLTSPDYPGRTGIGECAPLPALSCDDLPITRIYLPGLAGGWNSAGENWMRMPCATIRPSCSDWKRRSVIS